jgi:hypothetical protein
MRTDALGNVIAANNSDFAWSLSGNTIAAANFRNHQRATL